jgi:drug/metabolite transporter (DMT)-like permease
LRSTGAMLLIIAGACGYVLTDKEFAMNGWSAYTWVIIYMLIICFEMTYGKHIIKNVKMKNKVLGAVYYTNSIAILPMFILGFGVFGEGEKFGTFDFEFFGIIVLLISCVIGTCISYAAFNCRNLVSATTFTLVGVINKMITILINTLIWDNHASFFGILSLMLCIAGGTLYKQAPLRYQIEKPSHEDEVKILVEQDIELTGGKKRNGRAFA